MWTLQIYGAKEMNVGRFENEETKARELERYYQGADHRSLGSLSLLSGAASTGGVKPTEAPRPAGDPLGDGAFGDVWPLVSAIEGWLSRAQACALYNAAGAVEAGKRVVPVRAPPGRPAGAPAEGKSYA